MYQIAISDDEYSQVFVTGSYIVCMSLMCSSRIVNYLLNMGWTHWSLTSTAHKRSFSRIN